MSETKIPKKFEDFKVGELRTIADQEFAVEVGDDATKAEVLAALVESGVTFDQYLALHPELTAVIAEEPKVVAVEETADPGVVTATQMQAEPVQEEVRIVVKEETPLHTREEWLIKMDRENPLYEVRGQRFTQENPFALVSPEDAEYLLTKEKGFRQATPGELQQYYG